VERESRARESCDSMAHEKVGEQLRETRRTGAVESHGEQTYEQQNLCLVHQERGRD
jgi:hypothetical protein